MRSERGNPVPLLNLAELRRACPLKAMRRGLMKETGLCAETGERGESMSCTGSHGGSRAQVFISEIRDLYGKNKHESDERQT